MSDTDFNIDGLLEFEEDLMKRINNNLPDESAKLLDRAATNMKSRLEDHTPISEKKKKKNERMKYRWRRGKVTNKRGIRRVDVKNVAPHSYLYENGHIAQNGVFVKGSHLLEQQIEVTEKEIVEESRKLIDKVFGD